MGASDNFVQEAFKEADEMEAESLRSNSNISRLIASSKNAIETIEVDGVVIRFHGFLPRKVRRVVQSMSTENSDVLMYTILAELCIDGPYNKPTTWAFMEAEGGDVSGYLAKIMSKIQARTKQMIAFQ
jgi:hypothetical protein